MSRIKLSSHDQPLPVRWALRLYETAASLKLAVVLILSSAFVLALGTFVESAFGTPAAQFGVYQTWWFNALLVMLAITIFCAASIRYPWKRYQTGFVITHIGLLTLLGGTALSRWHGVDAQISIVEQKTDHLAYEDDHLFRLEIHERAAAGSGGSPRSDALATAPLASVLQIPFRPGPFNWSDYDTLFAFQRPQGAPPAGRPRGGEPKGDTLAFGMFRALSGALFANARPGSRLYHRHGIKLEVLDYHSDSRLVGVPNVQLRLSNVPRKMLDDEGRLTSGALEWTDAISLGVTDRPRHRESFPYGVGERVSPGGGHIVFWLAGSEAQTKAFLECSPEGPLGKQGQVALYAGGKVTRFLVEEKLGKEAFPLEGTGLTAHVVFSNTTGNPDDSDPHVLINVYDREQNLDRLVLHADDPELNVQAHKHQVFGDYWFDHGQLSAQQLMAGQGGSRVDLIQGWDKNLYYRAWNRREVAAARRIESIGDPNRHVTAFTMPAVQIFMYVDGHAPSVRLDGAAAKIPFDKDRNFGAKRPAAKVRLAVDGQTEEFWLASYFGDPNDVPKSIYEHRVIETPRRRVVVTMPFKTEDVGFRVFLDRFERKLDPGTSQPSHYSSTVHFLDTNRDRVVGVFDLASRRAAELKQDYGSAEPAATRAPRALALDPKNGYLYWVDGHRAVIERVALAGGPVETIPTRGNPAALAVAPGQNRLFLADAGLGFVFAMNPDGTQPRVLRLPARRPTALAVDSLRGRLYWADADSGTIGSADLDGGDIQEELVSGIGEPAGLAVDEENAALYWSDVRKGAIGRARLDGSGSRAILTRKLDEEPVGLAVDTAGGKIYWADRKRNVIRSANLDGTDDADVVTSGAGSFRLDRPEGLAHDAASGRLYWSQDATFRRDVWITMNAPVEFSNPRNGRSYRLFQESFAGPWKPGSPEFDMYVAASSSQDEVYSSTLSVNYDPGRGIRNLGCMLVGVGIFTMFYMRAYFFKRPETRAAGAEAIGEAAPTKKPKPSSLAEVSR